MARALGRWKGPVGRIQGFFQASGPKFFKKPLNLTVPGCHKRGRNVAERDRLQACHIYILLCMFNGFAFARPLCRANKVNLSGVGF
jgi:hypothetical protein